MRILVTGNMGYIGPCVVEHLRDSRPEAELIGLDTGFFAQCLTGTTLLPERRLDCQYFGDVRAVPAPEAHSAHPELVPGWGSARSARHQTR